MNKATNVFFTEGGTTSPRKKMRRFEHRNCGLSIVYVVLAIVLFILFGMTFCSVHDRISRERVSKIRNNFRQLYMAFTVYSEENDGHLPTASKWCDLLLKHSEALSKTNFKHPWHLDIECGVAFNTNLGDQQLNKVPSNAVLLFEAEGKWNLTGTAELLKKRDRITFNELLLVNGKIETYHHEKGGIERYNNKLKETTIEPLQWQAQQ